MSATDINVNVNFCGHPKVRKLQAALGLTAEVYVLRLWCHAGAYFPANGELTGYKDVDIEAAIGWIGAKGQCVKALMDCGFLNWRAVTRDSTGLFFIHDWFEHQTHFVRFQHKALLNKGRQQRYRDNRKSNALRNVPSNALRNAKVTGHQPTIPTLPYLALPKEVVDSGESTACVKKKLARVKFSIPTVADIKAFAELAHHSASHAEDFRDYYESNGWKVGKNPMRSWRAAYTRWCRVNLLNDKPHGRANRNQGTSNDCAADQYSGLGRKRTTEATEEASAQGGLGL